MSDNKNIDTEKYQGPGRLTAAVGEAKIYTIVGGIAGIPIGAGVASLVKPEGRIGQAIGKVASFFEMGGESKLRGALGGAKSGKGALMIAGMVVGSSVLGIVGFFGGLVHGWGKGNRGETQFNAIKAERDEARQTVASMQTQMHGLQEEVETHRKKFTDHVASRAEHGSHSATAAHDKEQSEMAASGRAS